MAPPPRVKAITRESVPGAPGWVDALLLQLNEALSQCAAALARGLTRRENMRAGLKEGVTFKTPASGVEAVAVKLEDGLPTPKHVAVSMLRRVDGAALSAAWSFTWAMNSQGRLELSFQGLPASTEFVCNLLHE